MLRYKRIGIVGGISPQSLVLFYKQIIEKHYKKYNDHYYPEIVISSMNYGKLKDFQNNPDQTDYINEYVKGIHILKKAGVDFAVIASNIPHRVFLEIEKRASIQLLCIVDGTANYAIKNAYKKLLLLGTVNMMKEDFYKNGLKAQNIKVVVPSYEEQELINNIIFNELIVVDIENNSKNAVLEIINKSKVDAVIFGCTELSLLITSFDTDIPLIDTADLHAEATLNYALL